MLHRAHLLLALLAVTSTCSGQNPYVDDIYGDGVHAFFRGEIYQAQEQFDRAIQFGSRDPRVFYFRAVLNLQNGDCFQAEQDIRTAVTYELQGRGTYDVGRSLERIQGPQRLELERMRLLAKLEVSAQRSLPQEQPYGPTSQGLVPDRAPMIPESPFDLDDQPPADSSDLDLDRPREQPKDLKTEPTPEITEPPVEKQDPFADDQVQPEVQPAEEPAAPEQAPEEAPVDEDPFGTDSTDDPFATGDEDGPT